MSWTPPQCIADEGLVNPDLFDIRAADIDTSTIYGSATALRSMATTVHDETAAMSSTWSGLPEGYEAPEQERVYALMSPAEQAAEDFKTTLDAMARHLETYASALEGIKPRLAAFEARAATFRAEVINGVTVSKLERKGLGLNDYAMAGLRWASRLDQDTAVVPWTEDGATVARNDAMLEEFQGFRVEVSTAAAQCANDVNALREFTPLAPLSPGPPAQVVPVGPGIGPAVSMPWGQARSEDRNCHETVAYGGLDHASSVLTGYKNFGTGIFEGASMMVVGRNPETGAMFEGDSYGQAWGGLFDLVVATGLATSTANRNAAARVASGESQDPVDVYMHEKMETAKNGWGSLIGYDGATPDDPWHRWKSDGVATYTESVLNVGTFFIPAGAAVKATGLSGKTVRVVAGAVDFAVPGGSWVVRTGVNAATGPRVLRFGAEGSIPNTAGLLAAIDGFPSVVSSPPGNVSDSIGLGAPEKSGRDAAPIGTRYDPETSRRATVNQSQGPGRPSQDDVHDAYRRAPVDETGQPVDHRNGEPLKADDQDGRRGWHMKWDPEHNEWVAENPGSGVVRIDESLFDLDPSMPHSGQGTLESPLVYQYDHPTLRFEDATVPPSSELSTLGPSKVYNLGSVEHMQSRWRDYQYEDGALPWNEWRDRYIRNTGALPRGTAFERAYFDVRGMNGPEWDHNTSVDKNLTGVDRNYDALSTGMEQRAVEVKSGSTVDPDQIAKDTRMVRAGWDVHYVFGKQPTPGTIAQLEKAGVTYEVFHSVSFPQS